jgi:hypothetical protein
MLKVVTEHARAYLFDHVDCGPGRPQGKYRQRLYRLKTLAPDGAAAQPHYDPAAQGGWGAGRPVQPATA